MNQDIGLEVSPLWLNLLSTRYVFILSQNADFLSGFSLSLFLSVSHSLYYNRTKSHAVDAHTSPFTHRTADLRTRQTYVYTVNWTHHLAGRTFIFLRLLACHSVSWGRPEDSGRNVDFIQTAGVSEC